MTGKRLVISATILAWVGVTLSAQGDPVLTDLQSLRLQNALLRVQLAMVELERARESANAVIHALQKPGYELDLERLVYVQKKGDNVK